MHLFIGTENCTGKKKKKKKKPQKYNALIGFFRIKIEKPVFCSNLPITTF